MAVRRQSVSTTAALFPLDIYPGQIITDLFGEESYFADADLFWQMQNEAIGAKRDALLAAGWHDVVVLEPGTRFMSWEHEKTPRLRRQGLHHHVAPRRGRDP